MQGTARGNRGNLLREIGWARASNIAQNAGAIFQSGARGAEAQLGKVAAIGLGVVQVRKRPCPSRVGDGTERSGSDDLRCRAAGASLRQCGVPLAVPGYQQESHSPMVRHEGVRESDEGPQI